MEFIIEQLTEYGGDRNGCAISNMDADIVRSIILKIKHFQERFKGNFI